MINSRFNFRKYELKNDNIKSNVIAICYRPTWGPTFGQPNKPDLLLTTNKVNKMELLLNNNFGKSNNIINHTNNKNNNMNHTINTNNTNNTINTNNTNNTINTINAT